MEKIKTDEMYVSTTTLLTSLQHNFLGSRNSPDVLDHKLLSTIVMLGAGIGYVWGGAVVQWGPPK